MSWLACWLASIGAGFMLAGTLIFVACALDDLFTRKP